MSRGVLEGAFRLLATLRQMQEAGLTRLAAGSGLPKGTAHRLLHQLISLGAVERCGGSRYRLGPQIFLLGRYWQPYPGLHVAASGPVRRLARDTNATLGIARLSAGMTLVTAVVPGETDRLMLLRPGALLTWRTAAGKLLVAHQQPQSCGQWAAEADAIRKRGLAFDRGELMPEVFCVAAPLRSPDGETVDALTAVTLSPRSLDALGPAVARVSTAINTDLRSAAAVR